MSTFLLKAAFCVFFVATVFIRYPHEKRQRQNTITDNQKTSLEKILLAIVSLGMVVLPLLYLFTPFLNFANYELPGWASAIG